MDNWLIDEQVGEVDIRRSLMRQVGFRPRGSDRWPPAGGESLVLGKRGEEAQSDETRAGGVGDGRLLLTEAPAIAVRLSELKVLNNRKWFDVLGGAAVRLDVLIVQGNVLEGAEQVCYSPGTFRFPNVRDGDRLPTDELLIYYGWPRHFLDIAIMVSRDRSDSDDLAKLLTRSAGSHEFKQAVAGVGGLAVAAPHVAAVLAATEAAAVLCDLAYKIVSKASGSTIGLYRGSKLAPDFGRGRQPVDGSFNVGQMSFWYKVEEIAK